MKRVINFSLALLVALFCFAAGFCAAEAAHTKAVQIQHTNFVDGETADERSPLHWCEFCEQIHGDVCNDGME